MSADVRRCNVVELEEVNRSDPDCVDAQRKEILNDNRGRWSRSGAQEEVEGASVGTSNKHRRQTERKAPTRKTVELPTFEVKERIHLA